MSDATGTVTVVIPLYQQRNFIERALRSVAQQTFRDFRCIVVDDGSTDGSSECVESFIRTTGDARVRLLTVAHRGPGAARNIGAAQAESNWVAFLDADDEWYPCFIEATLAAARADPSAVVIYTDVAARDRVPPRRVIDSGPVSDYFGTRMRHQVSATCSSVLVKRETLLATGGFDESTRYAEDIVAWFRMSCAGSFHFVAETLCLKETGPGRITSTAPALERADGLGCLMHAYQTYLRAGRIPHAQLHSTRRFMQHQRGRMAMHLAAGGRRASAWRLLLTGVPPGTHTWREYLSVLARTLRFVR
jgi:hypothetical protein